MKDCSSEEEHEANPVLERIKMVKKLAEQKEQKQEKSASIDRKPSNGIEDENNDTEKEYDHSENNAKNEKKNIITQLKQNYSYSRFNVKQDETPVNVKDTIIDNKEEENKSDDNDKEDNLKTSPQKTKKEIMWQKWIEEKRKKLELKELLENMKNEKKLADDYSTEWSNSVMKGKNVQNEEEENEVQEQMNFSQPKIAEKQELWYNSGINHIKSYKGISKSKRLLNPDNKVQSKDAIENQAEETSDVKQVEDAEKVEDKNEGAQKLKLLKLALERKGKKNDEKVESKPEVKEEMKPEEEDEKGADVVKIIEKVDDNNDNVNNPNYSTSEKVDEQTKKNKDLKNFIGAIRAKKLEIERWEKEKENNKNAQNPEEKNNGNDSEAKEREEGERKQREWALEEKRRKEWEIQKKERERALEEKRRKELELQEKEKQRALEEKKRKEFELQEKERLRKEDEIRLEKEKQRERILQEEMKLMEEKRKADERERWNNLKLKQEQEYQAERDNQLRLKREQKEKEETERKRKQQIEKEARETEWKLQQQNEYEKLEIERSKKSNPYEIDDHQNQSHGRENQVYKSKSKGNYREYIKPSIKTETVISYPAIKKTSSQEFHNNSAFLEINPTKQNSFLNHSSIWSDNTYQQEWQGNTIYNPKKGALRNKSLEKLVMQHSNTTKAIPTARITQMNSPWYSSKIPINSSSDAFEQPFPSSPSSPKQYQCLNTQQYHKNTYQNQNQGNKTNQIYNKTPISYAKVRQTTYSRYDPNENNQMQIPQPRYSAPVQNQYFQLNLEDLIVLEEKLSEILTSVNTSKSFSNECFEWWNYFFNCSLFRKIEKVFTDVSCQEVIQISLNYELLSVLICYNTSFDQSLCNTVLTMLKAILNSNHDNWVIICEYILSKISTNDRTNSWVYKLRNLVQVNKNTMFNSSCNSDLIDQNSKSWVQATIEKIKYNTNSINNDLRIVLKNYPKNDISEKLVVLFKNISTKTYEEINYFFQNIIMRVTNPNASVLASVVLREQSHFNTVAAPYIQTKNLKEFTLVLDLDETIIHFKSSKDDEGVLIERPGWIDFLETIGHYYEIIIFTAGTQTYADALIDAWEENRIFFDYRWYRQHAIIMENDFVKDLSRIGRPLDKMVIVDNMPQNFRLQKANGINIRTYWGEDQYDTALLELKKIWINIAKEGGDIRRSIAKYKDEIVKKVTLNISKQKF